MRRSLLLPVALLAACSDAPFDGGTSPDFGLSLLMANDEHFSFLQPVDPTPTYAGNPFNPNIAAVIEICALNNVGSCTAAPVIRVGVDDGIEVDTENERYEWELDFGRAPLAATLSYRLSVLTGPSSHGGTVLGSVRVVTNSNGTRQFIGENGEASDTFPRAAVVPVRFRIERGLFCTTLAEDSTLEPCLEDTIDDGGLFVTADGLAGVYIPPGSITDGIRRTIIIERYEQEDPEEGCLPTPFPQYAGCYRFLLEPALTEPFHHEAIAGVCPIPGAYGFQEQLDLMKWDESDPGTLIALPRRTIDWLECPDWEEGGGELTPAQSRLGALFNRVLEFFSPAPAYASFRGLSPFGGGLYDFSRLGWVRPLALEKVSGDNQTGTAGEMLADAVVVRVTAAGELVQGQDVPVSGIPVTFTPSGTSDVTPVVANTDADGLASTQWTLGTQAGAYTLTARGDNPLAPNWPNQNGPWGSAVTFSATAEAGETAYDVVFLAPVAKNGSSSGNVPDLDVRVEVCSTTNGGCDDVVWVMPSSELAAKQQFYQGAWKTSKDLREGSYVLRVVVNGNVVGTLSMEAGRGPGKGPSTTYRFNPGQNIPIRFIIRPV